LIKLYCVQYTAFSDDETHIAHIAAESPEKLQEIMDEEDIVEAYSFFKVDTVDFVEKYLDIKFKEWQKKVIYDLQ